MLNQTVLVGRIKEKPMLKELENKKLCELVLSVPRNYKDEDGEYQTDDIPCMLYNGIAENVVLYCEKGDLVGIKGRIENIDGSIKICTEKVTFLSSKKKEGE